MFHGVNDISTVIGQAFGSHGRVLLRENELGPDFFDLRTRLAGELFQKCMNYNLRLAVVVAEPARYGDRFRELVYEHGRHGNIRFFSDEVAALDWLSVNSPEAQGERP